MGQIVKLKGSSGGDKLYPVTKTTAVYNDAGLNVDELLASEESERSNDIAVLTSRMDTFESLDEGSTTGDAELIDLRIAADGETYDSAGTAVRTQINSLNLTTAELKKLISILDVEKADGAYVEDGYLYITSNEEIIAGPLGPFSGGGGGGGGSDNDAVLIMTNTSGWLSKTISTGASCNINFTWSSTSNDISTGPGTLIVLVDGVQKANVNIAQGAITFDVGPYLTTGTSTVTMRVLDSYSNMKYINYTVTSVLLSLSSTFSVATPYTDVIEFAYTPVGAVAKTVYFYLDGTLVGTEIVTYSGRQQTYTFNPQSHGAHKLRCYFEAEIDGSTVRSNELYYEFMSIEDGNTTPIITSSFNTETVSQYSTQAISYRVYTPLIYTSDVKLYLNDSLLTELNVDRTEQTYSLHIKDYGEMNFKIATGSVSKTITFTATQMDIDVEAETSKLALYLSSMGRSNNEASPDTWVYEDIEAEFTNFNFTSDGWQLDDDGITVLRVSGDARLTIPYKPFKTDCRSTGKTIEIEFATRNILNYDSSIISCLDNGRGFNITAQKATFKSEQSDTIYTQYKEDEHVRITFVVEKQEENRLIYIYINGVLSGAEQYPETDDFSQMTPQNISIGSSDCTTDIYCIRIYDNDLTRFQVLDNWIADTQDGETMYERYTRNNVFDDSGNIVISKLPSDLPYMIISCAQLPQYKGDKKTISGSFVNPENSDYSFTFDGASANVQGTSSQGYPRKNYKITFKNGFTINGEITDSYAMNEDAIPTDTFTFKADFASSEGANNVELVRLYNDACPYKTSAQEEDSRIRQGIDGFPIVMFWDNGTTTEFVGKANFNNDKGTPEVFGFADGDESWEIKNNTSNRVLWITTHYGEAYTDDEGTYHEADEWLNDFEGRYPEDNDDPTNLAELAEWIVSTDQDQATEDALDSSATYDGTTYTTDTAAYRLAKYKEELSDHMELQAVLFYYLFTELFLMVDSRAKNAFPTFMGGSKWFSLPYDFDTALGIEVVSANIKSFLIYGENPVGRTTPWKICIY